MNLKLLLLTSILILTGCNNNQESRSIAPLDLSDKALISRGSQLVRIAGCNDCHSTKKMTLQGPAPDSAYLLAGHLATETLPAISDSTAKNWVLFNMNATAFVGPWGTSFAANLTPDDTGIGNWAYQQFEIAMRQGKYKGIRSSRDLLPPMPWMNYQEMTDADMRAIFAYLKSLPPVNNVVPPPIAPKK